MPETNEPPGADQVQLSVVIAVRNAAETLPAQLDALRKQIWSGTWEIVVADNGSTDGTRDLVAGAARSEPRLRWIDASERPGPAHARNKGVDAARGTSIAFCDADDIVADGWLAAMADGLDRSDAVTGPQECGTLNPAWLQDSYGTARGNALQWFAGIFPFGPAANLGIRRSLFTDLGGFDPTLLVGEDLDLCMRLWDRGLVLAFAPEAIVHYRYRTALRDRWAQTVGYGESYPAIARRLAEAGRPAPPRWSGARRWAWLVTHLPLLRTRAGRARWIVVAGGAWGRLRGSVRSRYVTL